MDRQMRESLDRWLTTEPKWRDQMSQQHVFIVTISSDNEELTEAMIEELESFIMDRIQSVDNSLITDVDVEYDAPA